MNVQEEGSWELGAGDEETEGCFHITYAITAHYCYQSGWPLWQATGFATGFDEDLHFSSVQ